MPVDIAAQLCAEEACPQQKLAIVQDRARERINYVNRKNEQYKQNIKVLIGKSQLCVITWLRQSEIINGFEITIIVITAALNTGCECAQNH